MGRLYTYRQQGMIRTLREDISLYVYMTMPNVPSRDGHIPMAQDFMCIFPIARHLARTRHIILVSAPACGFSKVCLFSPSRCGVSTTMARQQSERWQRNALTTS